MIDVVIKRSGTNIQEIKIKGHAYSGEPGHDLVCAGVSAVTIGALNSLENVEESFNIKIDSGLVGIVSKSHISKRNEIVLDVLITSLMTIAENYGENIRIREERKN